MDSQQMKTIWQAMNDREAAEPPPVDVSRRVMSTLRRSPRDDDRILRLFALVSAVAATLVLTLAVLYAADDPGSASDSLLAGTHPQDAFFTVWEMGSL